MISSRDMTVESAWQKRFKFGLDTVNLVAYSYNGVLIIKDPIGIHFIREDDNNIKIEVIGFNVKKKTLNKMLQKYEGDRWIIRRPQDIGLRSGDRINGHVYVVTPTTLSTLYPGTLRILEND